MSELSSKIPAPIPSQNGGGTSAAKNPPPASGNQPGDKKPGPVEKPAPMVAPKPVEVAPFGGHKGGGKKRADGLIAGSEEAKSADREKNRLRMQNNRAAQRAADLPPPLPSASPANSNPSDALAANPSPVPAVAGNPVDAAAPVVPVTFVAWTVATLLRPIKLLTKICDRIRLSSLMVRVRKLGLTKDQEKEVEADFAYKAEAVADFNNALANCATVELNKRRVPGAEHSHWLDVLISGGELVSCHLTAVDKLEKMVAENAAKNLPPPNPNN